MSPKSNKPTEPQEEATNFCDQLIEVLKGEYRHFILGVMVSGLLLIVSGVIALHVQSGGAFFDVWLGALSIQLGIIGIGFTIFTLCTIGGRMKS